MLYQRLVEGYERISQTTRRTEMAAILVELLKETPPHLVHQVVYLTQGKLYPEFVPVEMGMAERLALKAVAEASGASEEEVRASLASTGDLGATAERLLRDEGTGRGETAPTPTLSRGEREPVSSPRLTVEEVYQKLDAIARTAGAGSVATKIGLMAHLLRQATPVEAKYILRTATGKLRLGLADMTLLDALALAYGGGKETRGEIERAYNLSSDLGALATALATRGLQEVSRFHLQPGKPVRPMLAQRLPSAQEVLKKLGGVCQAEYKYDGERLQLHKLGDRVSIFSRRLEDVTDQYPDAAQAVLAGVEAREAILESLNPSPRIQPIPSRRVDSVDDLEVYFQEAIEAGCEGLVCKSLSPGSVYEAGARGWNWIKYKREYISEMTDTVDLVVVGALYGRGKRRGTYGALLVSVYDPGTDSFPTVTKCGTGFTDKDLAELPGRLEPYRSDHRHPRVDARMQADVWFVPALVLEVLGAEITLSPIHTADWGKLKPNTGLAIRFPRFTGRYRPDKAPEDATTAQEILEMYQARLKKVQQ